MSLYDDALTALRAWTPPSDHQCELRDRYVTHLLDHPDGLSRECRPDHLTASTLVLSHDGERVLLTLHAKAGRWFQLGGHCEPGDPALADAAAREAREESGVSALRISAGPVQLSAHAVPFCGPSDDRVVHHLDVRYAAVAPPGATTTLTEESLDLRWWPVEALPEPDSDLVELVSLGRAWLSGSVAGAGSERPSRRVI